MLLPTYNLDMPKQISEHELNAILASVSVHPNGAQVADIREGLPFELPARTLQRRLALLVERNRLIAEGRGKGRRYRVPKNVTITTEPARLQLTTHPASVEIYPAVSPQAQEVKEAVRAPIQNRRPVGYQRSFLDDYEPNASYYLSPEIRQ